MSDSAVRSPLEAFSRSLAHIAVVRGIVADLDELAKHPVVRKKSFVLRAYVVYLVAAWQQFIQQTARSCITWRCEQEGRPELAEPRIEQFHDNFGNDTFTKSNRISKAVKEAAGVASVMQRCHWRDWPSERVKKQLAALRAARNEIAHKGYASGPLSLEVNYTWMAMLYGIGAVINNAVNEEFPSRHRAAPFPSADPVEAFEQLQQDDVGEA